MRVLRLFAAAIVLILPALSAGIITPVAANAADSSTCHNGDSTPRPPFNWTDICYVASTDVQATFIADLTGDDDICNGLRHTPNSHRIRVVGSFISGPPGSRKLRIHSIDIRYLSGAKPWAYYQLMVYDGNDAGFSRDWNNGGFTMDSPASRVVEQTIHVVPNPGFAPNFGGHGYVSVRIRPHFTDSPGGPQLCVGDPVTMRLREP